MYGSSVYPDQIKSYKHDCIPSQSFPSTINCDASDNRCKVPQGRWRNHSGPAYWIQFPIGNFVRLLLHAVPKSLLKPIAIPLRRLMTHYSSETPRGHSYTDDPARAHSYYCGTPAKEFCRQ